MSNQTHWDKILKLLWRDHYNKHYDKSNIRRVALKNIEDEKVIEFDIEQTTYQIREVREDKNRKIFEKMAKFLKSYGRLK